MMRDEPSAAPAPLTLRLADASATQAFARELAPCLTPGMVIWLDGELGAGKTTLVREVLRACGHAGPVKSPTYTLVEVYVVSRIYWYHFDFYRFNEPEEFADAGLGEYFRDDSICLVEWPGKGEPYVPAADLTLLFRFSAAGSGEDARVVELRAHSGAARACLTALKSRFPAAAS